jgi:hypothetical protein
MSESNDRPRLSLHSAESDQARPERSPLFSSLAAERYAVRLRQAARRFRENLSPIEDHELCEECGRLIIEAYRQEYLPASPEMRERIDWHTAEDTPLFGRKPQARLLRCAGNLFIEVVGGDTVQARWNGHKWEIVKDELLGYERRGGVIPAYSPDILRLPDAERKAEACLFLADLIDRAVSAPLVPQGSDRQIDLPPEAKLTSAGYRKVSGGDTLKRAFDTSHDSPECMAKRALDEGFIDDYKMLNGKLYIKPSSNPILAEKLNRQIQEDRDNRRRQKPKP